MHSMKATKHLFTSESVAMGHPDKVADQISDAVLDDILSKDKNARVACETLVTTGLVLVSGEITTACYCDIPVVARETIREIGYTDPHMGFDYENCAVVTSISPQSLDISQGVAEGEGLHKEQGAGDQGLMFGYACTETPEYMPLPIQLAHRLMENIAELRQSGKISYLRPDGKCQVTVEYHDDAPKRVHTVVVSTQHNDDVEHDTIKKDIIEKLIVPTIGKGLLDSQTIYHVNPTGRFVVGGPKADCGLTGRKIIVDTYGGRGSHGGGCFSGKDPSKVDRSASYAARHTAKNIVAAGLADKCEVQLSYAIGIAEPISINVNTEGTAKLPEDRIADIIGKLFDLTPTGMIKHLDLRRPIYKETARHGHFGRNHPDFTWEKLDMVDAIRSEAGI